MQQKMDVSISLDAKSQIYAKQLKSCTEDPARRMTIDYLTDHGIDGATAGKYQLGLCSNPAPGDERFKGMLAIPYQTRAGIVAIKYRCTAEHDCRDFGHGRYSQYLGQTSRLFNSRAFFTAGNTIGISEGEIDAIAATERVGIPTLGMSGVTQWQAMSRVWKIALRDYDTVVYFADGDKAGIDCGRTVVGDLGAKGRLVKCDSEEDVASMVAKGEAMKLQKAAGL